MVMDVHQFIHRWPLAELSPPESRRIRQTSAAEAVVLTNPKLTFERPKYCMVKFNSKEIPAWVVDSSTDTNGNILYVLENGLLIPERRLVGVISLVITEVGNE